MTETDVTQTLELIRAAQAGRKEALDRLCTRYHDRVLRIVRIRLGRRLRSSLDSLDVLQDTFTAAIGSFDAFEMRDDASLINWLAKLAENQIIRAARHHGALKRTSPCDVGFDEGPPPGTGPATPDELLIGDEEHALVDACVAELKDEHREIVTLRDYAGASWKTVAEMVGLPSATAARHKHAHAMIALGKLMRARGLEE